MKRFILLLLTFVIVAVIAYFYSIQKPGQEDAVVQVPATPSPSIKAPVTAKDPPQRPFVPGAPNSVVFSYAGPLPSPPSVFPIYKTVFTPDIKNPVFDFAGKIGFNSPTSTRTLEGKTFTIWSSDSHSLSLVEDPQAYSVAYQLIKSSSSQNRNDPVGIAVDFLQTLVKPPDILSVRAKDRQQIISSEGMPDGAKITRGFTFEYLLNKHPLILVNYDTVSAWVGVDDRNTVRSVTVTLPPSDVVFTENKASLPLENALRSLNGGKGLLISVKNTQYDLYGAKPEFTSVTLNSLISAYYFDKQTGLLLPVYIFEGIGLTKEGQQHVQYFLHATD